MDNLETIEYRHYYPSGVHNILAVGTSAFIGSVNDSTILKYPLKPGGDMTRLEIEHQILEIMGDHPRIIEHKGFTEEGLYLELAPYGSVYSYLTESKQPGPTIRQRVVWCRELVEAVEHAHSKRVLHCDIQPANVLVDKNLGVKLADFQGRYLSEDGTTILTGWSGEACRYFCPRDDEFMADAQTDIFALGSTIFFIMNGYEVFPEIVSGQSEWEHKIRSRFESGLYPEQSHICEIITRRCWERKYGSASELLIEIKEIEQELA